MTRSVALQALCRENEGKDRVGARAAGRVKSVYCFKHSLKKSNASIMTHFYLSFNTG